MATPSTALPIPVTSANGEPRGSDTLTKTSAAVAWTNATASGEIHVAVATVTTVRWCWASVELDSIFTAFALTQFHASTRLFRNITMFESLPTIR